MALLQPASGLGGPTRRVKSRRGKASAALAVNAAVFGQRLTPAKTLEEVVHNEEVELAAASEADRLEMLNDREARNLGNVFPFVGGNRGRASRRKYI